MEWFIIYLLIANLFGFCLMGIDKRRARRHAWRISEVSLFFVALIGGSIGSIISMRIFHHKTKHWYFVWGMPAILLLQIVCAVVVLYTYYINGK